MTELAVAQIEVRGIDEPRRVVTFRVCRYGETSTRTGHEHGERFLTGAFTRSVGQRRDRVPFTTRHTDGTGRIEERAKVARPIQWQAGDTELAAVIKFYDTPAAWDAYDRVRAGEIDAGSVGFEAVEERTGEDGAREVVLAELHHVALLATGDGSVPAYEAPRVLEVRGREVAALLDVKWDPALAEGCVDPAELARMGN
jgi:HK97 family phage prohead protease